MKCAVQIYRVLGRFHVYKSVFLGWVVGRFNIAVNGEHNCGVSPIQDYGRLRIRCMLYDYIKESHPFRNTQLAKKCITQRHEAGLRNALMFHRIGCNTYVKIYELE